MGLTNLLPARIREEYTVIRHFQNSAATSPQLARSPEDVNADIPGLRPTLRRLIRKGIIRRLPPGDTCYLDEKKLLQHRMNRVKWGFILLFLMLGIIFLVLPGLQ